MFLLVVESSNTHIYHRGSYEYKFLEEKEIRHGESWLNDVHNCNGIDYSYDGKKRKYIPDFIRHNRLFEIKSSYTWDDFGKNLDRRNQNIAKLDAAILHGYDVFLVLDFKEYDWKTERYKFIQ